MKKLKWPGPWADEDCATGDLLISDLIDFDWTRDDPKTSKEIRENYDPEIIELFAISVAEGNIFNGGFYQFIDLSGELAEDALNGLRRHGIHEFVDLFDAAYNCLGRRPIPVDKTERDELILRRFGPVESGVYGAKLAHSTFNPFDMQFYKLWETGDKDGKNWFLPIYDYLLKNKQRLFDLEIESISTK